MSELKLPVGTPVLYMDSPSFTEDVVRVLGLQSGEKLEITTPQFERTDGLQVHAPTEFTDWENLHKKDAVSLRVLGFGIWNETEKGTHWLFPKEWYDRIPDGYPITYITGEQEVFKNGETDDDYRFGCLAFGFIQEPSVGVS